MTGAHFTLYPSLTAKPIDLLTIRADAQHQSHLPGSPGPYGVFASADGEQFLYSENVSEENRWRWRWRLCGRDGQRRPLTPAAPDVAASSMRIAGFAKGDREVIAYNEYCLFAIKVTPPRSD